MAQITLRNEGIPPLVLPGIRAVSEIPKRPLGYYLRDQHRLTASRCAPTMIYQSYSHNISLAIIERKPARRRRTWEETMQKMLSSEVVQQYHRDGYYFPVPVLSRRCCRSFQLLKKHLSP